MFQGVLLGSLLMASPAVGSTSDVDHWGPLRFERTSTLTWPGLHAPVFSLIEDRRSVHSFTLGFTPPALQRLELSMVSIEGDPRTPTLRRAIFDPSAQGSIWVGASIALPGPSKVRVAVGRSHGLASSVLSTAAMVSRGQRALPRLLVSGRI